MIEGFCVFFFQLEGVALLESSKLDKKYQTVYQSTTGNSVDKLNLIEELRDRREGKGRL